jgi:hypothetical protein
VVGRVVYPAVYACCGDILTRLPAFCSIQALAFLPLLLLMLVGYGIRQELVLRY